MAEHPPDETPYDRLRIRYEEGRTPWDVDDPPPEVIDLVAALPPGRVLDLGCGYGRAARYMARRGWSAVGVDFIEIPILEARRRAAAENLSVDFLVADITDLARLAEPFDLAVDVGCAHSLTEVGWRRHHAELRRLLRPGGIYLLYARLREEEWGLEEAAFLDLMQDGFQLEKAEHGITDMDDGQSFASAWYWLRRQNDS